MNSLCIFTIFKLNPKPFPDMAITSLVPLFHPKCLLSVKCTAHDPFSYGDCFKPVSFKLKWESHFFLRKVKMVISLVESHLLLHVT